MPGIAGGVSTIARVMSRRVPVIGAAQTDARFIIVRSEDARNDGLAHPDVICAPDGKAIEHWDVLQVVGTPASAANWYAPNIPAANPNGMF